MKTSELAAVITFSLIAGGLIGVNIQQVELPADSSQTSGFRTAEAKVVGTEGDRGVIGEVNVSVKPGDGDILVATQPYVKTNTQASAKIASRLAENYTGVNLENKDVVYSFNISSGVIGGPSAGAAMTIATIAAISGEQVRDDAVVTGTVNRYGEIGRIGSVVTKSRAAGRAGMENFYVPPDQTTKVNYEKVLDTERDGFLIYRDIEYRRQVFNISRYTQERFGMTTESVDDIEKLAELMLEKS